MNNPNTKTCTKCGEVKDKSEFHKHPLGIEGLHPQCKSCRAIERKIYRENNQEAIAERNNIYKINNREKVLAYNREYAVKNFEKEKAKLVAWRLNNPDKYKEQVRRENHKRRVRMKQAESFAINDSFLKKLYSSSCAICGSDDRIQADHIIPITKGGTHSEGNLQPLCISCNSSKGNKLMIEWKIQSGKER